LDSADARKLQREQAIALRRGLADRAGREAALRARVADWLTTAGMHAVGFYWPVRGEPDLRDTIAEWLTADANRVAALPRIAGDMLEFRQWHRDALMQAGAFGIPVPAHGRVVHPDCLLIPCVGFDAARFRLGYGGGFYDRTYATLVPWPFAVGIAFEATRFDSIDPQPHDMQLDVVLTDAAQY
jgi:5,10-methenyltetrahydrofolate synthetase